VELDHHQALLVHLLQEQAAVAVAFVRELEELVVLGEAEAEETVVPQTLLKQLLTVN
jgi:hypothetical protein